MISYVAKAIHIFAATIQNVLLIASLTGELIISLGLWTYRIISNMLQTILSFFHIVYEDNVCIFTELPNSAKDIIDSTFNQFLLMKNGFETIFYYIYFKINAIVTSFAWLINAVYVIVSEVIILLTNMIMFMGDTTWLLVTFIPVHLPQLIRSAIKYITTIIINIIVNSYMKLLKFTNYLTEVPLESFLGITSAIIIVRLCVYYKETILTNIYNFYWLLVRNSLYLYYACYNYWTNTEVQVITRMASGDIMSSREVAFEDINVDDANTAADALCVICQERQKCVLTLPCRHICLCTECCRRLYGYQRTCPICRSFIYHSVTVYW